LFESEFIGFSVSDEEGVIREANAAFLHRLGYTEEDVVAGRLRWSELLPGRLGLQTQRGSRQFFNSASLVPSEVTLRHSDGHSVPVLLGVAPFEDSLPATNNKDIKSGKRHLIFLVDISDIKRAQQERDQLLKQETAHRREAEAAARRITRIQSITDAALSHLDADKLVLALLERIHSALNCDVVRLFLLDKDHHFLTVRAAFPVQDGQDSVTMPVYSGIIGRVAQAKHAMRIDDLKASQTGDLFAPWQERSFLGTPLFIQGNLTGVLCATRQEPAKFNDGDLELLELIHVELGFEAQSLRGAIT
jgi:PAS domain S-box-containing protein